MSFVDADGNNLTKTELLALTSEVSTETVLEFGADVYQKFTFDNASQFEGGRKLAFHEGQQVKQSDIDALFKTATIDTISPATGLAAGGTNVTITGTDFSGAEGVTFGGTAATNFKVVSNTRITCTTPAKTAGTYNVVVQDDAGDATKTNGFVYT